MITTTTDCGVGRIDLRQSYWECDEGLRPLAMIAAGDTLNYCEGAENIARLMAAEF